MTQWLVYPPVAFALVFSVVALSLRACAGLGGVFKKKPEKGGGQPYACGERNYDNQAHPDYSIIFPFAFFFTLAHVATLMVTTLPVADAKVFALALLYILGAVTGLSVLFKR